MWKALINNKYAFWAVIIIVLIIIALIAKGSIQSWIRKIRQRKTDKEILDKADSRIDSKKLTYPSDTYTRYAKRIHEAIDNGWYNVNETRVINTFKKLENNDDVEQLIAAFGRKDGDTLSDWLYWGLNDDEIEQINSYFQSKGIGYQF